MMHLHHPAQAHTVSTAGRGLYSRVEPGVRAQCQSFGSSVSVLRWIMLESHQDPMTAQTRRRAVCNQPHDVSSLSDLWHRY
jgi:hypothetical protein